MATVRPSGAGDEAVGTGEVRDGGTIFHAGNADTTTGPISNVTTIISTVDDLRSIGSKVVVNDGTGASTTDRVGVDQVVQERPIAFTAGATEWIMRGGGVTTTLSGSGYTGFATPGADFNGAVRDNVHEYLAHHALGSGNGTFDVLAVPSTEITPGYTKGGDAGSKRFFVAPSGAGDVTATDDAATPTRSVPGELTYHYGGLGVATTDEYKAKDAFES